jgi:hypothetical protein
VNALLIAAEQDARTEEALAQMRDIMTKLTLTVNEKGRECVSCRKKNSTSWGIRLISYSPKTGRACLGTVPSRSVSSVSVKRLAS